VPTPEPAGAAIASLPAVVLAGGRGTRIAEVTRDRLPKALLPVGGRPFLAHQLDWLAAEGVRVVVLAVGFLADRIREACGERWRAAGGELALRYSADGDRPLGTGGAARRALGLLPEATRALVLNGDTWFPLALAPLLALHAGRGAEGTLALARRQERGAYGAVELAADGRVLSFEEKAEGGPGWINGGVSVLERSALDAAAPAGEPFSLERDLLPAIAARGRLFGLAAEAPFCDIGLPETYAAFAAGAGATR
jgi:NDP-sugar pyrophosphorylase family protein